MHNEQHSAPLKIVCVIIAMVLWALAAVPYTWPPEPHPWRERFIAAGLFFWGLSTFF